MGFFSDLFFKDEKENNAAFARSEREAIVEFATLDGGTGKVEIARPRLAYLRNVLQISRANGVDVDGAIESFHKRTALAKLASQADALHSQATLAEQVVNVADLEEGRRRREALAELDRLREKARVAQLASEDAMGARAELVRDAYRSPEEMGPAEEVSKLCAEIKKLEKKLDPTASPGSGLSPMAGVHPAALARATRSALADIASGKRGVNSAPQRKSALEQTLVAAEAAVAEVSKELVGLQKKRAELNSQAAAFSAAHLLPESFRIMRLKPTAGQRMKQLAAERGYVPSQV